MTTGGVQKKRRGRARVHANRAGRGYRGGVAKGSAIGRLEATLGVVGLLALATTYFLITGWNPVPGFADWLERSQSLAEPETSWSVRLKARPEYAVVAGNTAIMLMRGEVAARDARNGDEIWAREVPWAAVAGADSNAVVVVGRNNERGFEVVDPGTGAVLWNDTQAIAVWTYREAVLALTCPGPADCTLAARDTARGGTRWTTRLTGLGRTLAGVNHELRGSRDLAPPALDSRINSPQEMPPLLGFPLDGKVQVVETGTGRRVREATASATTRVVVVGGRVLHSTAQRREGHCRYTLEARDPVTGEPVWRKEGYDLRTASGAGCEQRRDPGGGGDTLSATRGDNREVLLGASDGRELWVGEPGERALTTDGRIAVIRAADDRTVKAVDLGDGRTLWRREVTPEAEAFITRYTVLIMESGRVLALQPGSGRPMAEAETDARVIGVGGDGVLLAAGRRVGLLPNGAVGALPNGR